MIKDGIFVFCGHYEVYVNGIFISSADTYPEARQDYYHYIGKVL